MGVPVRTRALHPDLCACADARVCMHILFAHTATRALLRRAYRRYDEILRRYRLGYEYAAKLHADGRFDHFRLAELVVQGEGEGMSEVLVPEGQQPQAQPADVVVSAPAAAAAAPTQGKPGGNNIVAVPVTAHMHNPNSMHHPAPTPSAAPPPQQQAGLVLELHQPHEEQQN